MKKTFRKIPATTVKLAVASANNFIPRFYGARLQTPLA
jgi:hypothetical protein